MKYPNILVQVPNIGQIQFVLDFESFLKRQYFWSRPPISLSKVTFGIYRSMPVRLQICFENSTKTPQIHFFGVWRASGGAEKICLFPNVQNFFVELFLQPFVPIWPYDLSRVGGGVPNAIALTTHSLTTGQMPFERFHAIKIPKRYMYTTAMII